MKLRSSISAFAAALALGACGTEIPRGPALSYEQLLPMTHENPKWARSAWQTQMQQQAAEPQQPVQAAPAPPAQPPASAPASPR